jgi:hypothetical protein
MRAGRPTGSGIRLKVYGVRLTTVPANGGFRLVTDEKGRFVPTGERYRIPRAPAAQMPVPHDCPGEGCDCPDPGHDTGSGSAQDSATSN